MPTTSITDSPVNAQPQPCPAGLQVQQPSLPTPLTATMTSHVPETIVCKEFYVPPLYGHSLTGATTAATPMATGAACYGQCCDYGRACVSAYTSPIIPVPYYPLPFSVSPAEGQRLQQRQAPVYPLYPTPQEPSTAHLNAKEREELAFAKATAEVNAVNAKNASSLPSPLHDTSPGVPSMLFANAGPSGVCQMSYSSPSDNTCTGTGMVNEYGYGYAHGYGHGYAHGYGDGYGYIYDCGYGGPMNNAGYVGV